MILTIGDSFTLGEELEDLGRAWPYLLDPNAVNLGRSGTSNDSMLRLAIENTIDRFWDLVIVAWTHPSRFECYNEISQQLDTVMPGSQSGLPWCADYYKYSYKEEYAYARWFHQILLLQSWFQQRQQPYLFVAIDKLEPMQLKYVPASFWTQIDTAKFVGWHDRGIIQMCKDTPLGPGGHPLEQGHKIIADEIRTYIRV